MISGKDQELSQIAELLTGDCCTTLGTRAIVMLTCLAVPELSVSLPPDPGKRTGDGDGTMERSSVYRALTIETHSMHNIRI